ncbi:MAG: hypothetical protein ACTSV7_06350 [Candidatus Baldrarchaeia archaeon]
MHGYIEKNEKIMADLIEQVKCIKKEASKIKDKHSNEHIKKELQGTIIAIDMVLVITQDSLGGMISAWSHIDDIEIRLCALEQKS